MSRFRISDFNTSRVFAFFAASSFVLIRVIRGLLFTNGNRRSEQRASSKSGADQQAGGSGIDKGQKKGMQENLY